MPHTAPRTPTKSKRPTPKYHIEERLQARRADLPDLRPPRPWPAPRRKFSRRPIPHPKTKYKQHRADRYYLYFSTLDPAERTLEVLQRHLRQNNETISLRTLERYSTEGQWSQRIQQQEIQDDDDALQLVIDRRYQRQNRHYRSRLTPFERNNDALGNAFHQLCPTCTAQVTHAASQSQSKRIQPLQLCLPCTECVLPSLYTCVNTQPDTVTHDQLMVHRITRAQRPEPDHSTRPAHANFDLFAATRGSTTPEHNDP